MTTMTPEDLERLVAAAVQAAMQGMRTAREDKRMVKEETFRRVPEFQGRDLEWKDFAFQFKDGSANGKYGGFSGGGVDRETAEGGGDFGG